MAPNTHITFILILYPVFYRKAQQDTWISSMKTGDRRLAQDNSSARRDPWAGKQFKTPNVWRFRDSFLRRKGRVLFSIMKICLELNIIHFYVSKLSVKKGRRSPMPNNQRRSDIFCRFLPCPEHFGMFGF